MLFSGLARHTSYMDSGLARDMANILWMSLTPLIFKCALDLTLTHQVPEVLSAVRIEATAATVLLIPIFGFWLLYKRTHRVRWAESLEDFNRADGRLAESLDVTTSTQLTYCAIAASGIVAMIFIARSVIASISTLGVTSSVPVEFFGFIIYPTAAGCSNLIKAADFAYHKHPFNCLSLTFGAAIASITVTFPLLLFIS